MTDKLEMIFCFIKYRYFVKFSSRKKLINYQNKKMKKHLDFVTTNSRFYEDYKNKSLDEFPTVDKKIMMDNFNEFNTVSIDKEKAMEFAIEAEKTREFSSKLKNVTIGLSSGTSNNRGLFLVSDHEKNIWAGYILAKMLPKDLKQKQRIAFFMRANSNLYESVNSKLIDLKFFDIYEDINENIKTLQEYNPTILIGQPSVLRILSKYINRGNLKVSVRKLISIAEVLEDTDKEFIKESFKVDIVHQVYQCTEGFLAHTCEYGELHLNEDIVRIDKEYIDEKRFIPIITDFTRTSQPIIKYRLNDILVMEHKKCKCNNQSNILKKIEGRQDDIFMFTSNEGKDVIVFPDFIRRCMLFVDNVSEYRVVQKEDQSIVVYINCDDVLKERILKQFQQLAQDKECIVPTISFEKYCFDNKRKLKRVEKEG